MTRRVSAIARLWRVGPLVWVVASAACASPTLPLPPPMQPTVGMGSDANHVKLSSPCGGAEGGAIVVVENTNTSVANDQRVSGSVASTCGAWDANVYAHSGDVLQVTQEFGTQTSTPVVVQIR